MIKDPSKVIKKAHYVYGNKDYPSLRHSTEKVISKVGKYRLTEKMYEFLYREMGYKPAPETALQRKIQVKRWWGWKTLKADSFRVEANKIIQESFLGYNFDWEATWNLRGMNIETLTELNRKK